MALGIDFLDEVQMRNEFQRAFMVGAPLSLFATPNQTLDGLAAKLAELL